MIRSSIQTAHECPALRKCRGGCLREAISWLSTLDYSPSTLDYWVVLSLPNGLEYNLHANPAYSLTLLVPEA